MVATHRHQSNLNRDAANNMANCVDQRQVNFGHFVAKLL